MENPATKTVRDIETSMQPDYAELIYADGRLYMSQVVAQQALQPRARSGTWRSPTARSEHDRLIADRLR